MKSYTVKRRKSQRKTNYTRQNENSQNSLACVTMLDYNSTLVIIYSKSKLEVNKRSRTFITVITQIRTFSLNLGTSNKNFETTKYSLERSFQKK